MRVLLASSECFPYSKTGGLADMVGALGKALGADGHGVHIVTPLYGGIRQKHSALKREPLEINVQLGPRIIRSEEHTSELQSPCNLVCRLLLEKKKNIHAQTTDQERLAQRQ